MTELMKLALDATEKNVSTAKSRKSINDQLFELLYDKSQSLTRQEIITELSLNKLKNQKGEVTEEVLKEAIEDGRFKKINKTIKNGLDTAIANGKTSASFSANKKYQNYELICENNEYTIVDK